MWIIWRNNQNWKFVRKYAKPLDLGPVPLQKTVWRSEGLKLFLCAQTLPLTLGIKWKNNVPNTHLRWKILQYSKKMEKMNIFQMDGKFEYIPKEWKSWKDSKIMEKRKIFQKDGKVENIPIRHIRWQYSKRMEGGIYIPKDFKTQNQLRALPWQEITMMLIMTGLTLGIYRFCQGHHSTGNNLILMNILFIMQLLGGTNL